MENQILQKSFNCEQLEIDNQIIEISKWVVDNHIEIVSISEYSYSIKGILYTRITIYYKENVNQKNNALGREEIVVDWEKGENVALEVLNDYLGENQDIKILNLIEFGFWDNAVMKRRIIIYFTIQD